MKRPPAKRKASGKKDAAELRKRLRRTELKERELELAATAEILHVISSTPTDAAPVFEAIVRAGVRLFEGAAVAVTRPEDGEVRLMAIAERDPEQADKWRQRFPFPCSRDYMHGAALLDCTMVDVPDISALSGRLNRGHVVRLE